MDESTLRRIVGEIVRDEVKSVRDEVKSVRDEVKSVRDEVKSAHDNIRAEVRASEERLAEGGRLQFRQLSELYRSTLEKVDHLERHLGERIDATRGAIEALRSTLERQNFRADELARRIATLETRPPG